MNERARGETVGEDLFDPEMNWRNVMEVWRSICWKDGAKNTWEQSTKGKKPKS